MRNGLPPVRSFAVCPREPPAGCSMSPLILGTERSQDQTGPGFVPNIRHAGVSGRLSAQAPGSIGPGLCFSGRPRSRRHRSPWMEARHRKAEILCCLTDRYAPMRAPQPSIRTSALLKVATTLSFRAAALESLLVLAVRQRRVPLSARSRAHQIAARRTNYGGLQLVILAARNHYPEPH